jgi:hypothetical protein
MYNGQWIMYNGQWIMYNGQWGLPMELLGDGIVAVATPRMTAEDAAHGEVESLDGAVLLDGFNCVLRAGGCKAARRRRQGADATLVKADGEDEKTAEHGGEEE